MSRWKSSAVNASMASHSSLSRASASPLRSAAAMSRCAFASVAAGESGHAAASVEISRARNAAAATGVSGAGPRKNAKPAPSPATREMGRLTVRRTAAQVAEAARGSNALFRPAARPVHRSSCRRRSTRFDSAEISGVSASHARAAVASRPSQVRAVR